MTVEEKREKNKRTNDKRKQKRREANSKGGNTARTAVVEPERSNGGTLTSALAQGETTAAVKPGKTPAQKRPLATPSTSSSTAQAPPRKKLFQPMSVVESAPGGGRLSITRGSSGSISSGDWDGIVNKLTAAILANRDGTCVKIDGNGRSTGSGWGNFHCHDSKTVGWVTAKIKELFEGVYECWPPRTHPPSTFMDNSRHINTWISGVEAPSTEMLRDVLTRQNEGVDVSSWQIVYVSKSTKWTGYTLRLRVTRRVS